MGEQMADPDTAWGKDSKACKLVDQVLKKTGNKRIFVGHTVQGRVKGRCEDRFWPIDVGMSSAFDSNWAHEHLTQNAANRFYWYRRHSEGGKYIGFVKITNNKVDVVNNARDGTWTSLLSSAQMDTRMLE